MTLTLTFEKFPQGYGLLPNAIPNKLVAHGHPIDTHFRVVSESWTPDGSIYEVGKKRPRLHEIPYIQIPTGTKTIVVEIGDHLPPQIDWWPVGVPR